MQSKGSAEGKRGPVLSRTTVRPIDRPTTIALAFICRAYVATAILRSILFVKLIV